ncbi:NAD-dependent epimerase/dehydratase family protein [Geodermatophilus sp. SYSU D01105]
MSSGAVRGTNTAQERLVTDELGPGVDLFGTPVLVTGGTGFLGSFVVPRLVAAGCRVTVVAPDPGWREPVRQAVRDGVVRLVSEAEWWRPEVARRVARSAAGAEHLVHLAYAPVPPGQGTPVRRAEHEVGVNVCGLLELVLALGEQVGHVVLTSSLEEYSGTPPCPLDEDVRPEPADAYGAARLALEDQLRVVAATGGPEATVLRLSTVYGPGETVPRAVPRFIRAGLAGLPATIPGDGLERRDYLHVTDAARLVTRAVARPPGAQSGFRLVHGGSGTAERTVALAQRVRRLLAARGVEAPQPQHIEGPYVADVLSRTDRAREELGFEALVDLDEGLAGEIEWFAARPELWRDLGADATV